MDLMSGLPSFKHHSKTQPFTMVQRSMQYRFLWSGSMDYPGAQAEGLLGIIRKNGWMIEKILLTHGHFDHMGAVDEIRSTLHIPVFAHKRSGEYLLDARKNLSALCGPPITSTDGTWVNNEIISYEMVIRVWDFYDKVGWHGPDGSGTPTLLLMNLADEDGDPVDNAYYSGKQKGVQVFAFNDAFGDGSCSDIVGHEYTHCLTNVSRIHDYYFNDMGAINEGISDIMGNLIEMMFGKGGEGQGFLRRIGAMLLYRCGWAGLPLHGHGGLRLRGSFSQSEGHDPQ